MLLAYARKVVIIPGYGLAVAQAQHTARELADLLMERGVEVFYAIHPVAGRMPGHMNVLLAEANVPYDELKEMDEANPEMATADVALVVGANDTVNPAAKNTAGSPIYGMPIINADEAENIVFLKRSMRPGFAGIDNELLFDDKTTLLFGDAKDTLTKLVAAVKDALVRRPLAPSLQAWAAFSPGEQGQALWVELVARGWTRPLVSGCPHAWSDCRGTCCRCLRRCCRVRRPWGGGVTPRWVVSHGRIALTFRMAGPTHRSLASWWWPWSGSSSPWHPAGANPSPKLSAVHLEHHPGHRTRRASASSSRATGSAR